MSVFIFYIFKWFYAFNKKEMSYEKCVGRITKLLQAVDDEEETLGVKTVKVMCDRVKYLYMSRRRIGRVEVQIHSFLSSVLDGGEWSASWPVRFTPRKEPRYHYCGMGGPRNCSGHLEEQKDLLPLLVFEHWIVPPIA
jgi:hypothetical protein